MTINYSADKFFSTHIEKNLQYIRKTDNFSILCFDHTRDSIDSNLYEYSSAFDNILGFTDSKTHNLYMETPTTYFLKLKIRNRFVLIEKSRLQYLHKIPNYERCDKIWYFSTQDEVTLFKNKRIMILNKELDNLYNNYFKFLTIDLKQMDVTFINNNPTKRT